MATKKNPGKFDCYANAKPDEPMFVLLGRDAMAGALVRLWADMREVRGEDPAKVAEARACADTLDAWATKLSKEPVTLSARCDRRWALSFGDGTKLYLYAYTEVAARKLMEAKQAHGDTFLRSGKDTAELRTLGAAVSCVEEPHVPGKIVADNAPGMRA